MANQCPKCNLQLNQAGRCPQCDQAPPGGTNLFRLFAVTAGAAVLLIVWGLFHGQFGDTFRTLIRSISHLSAPAIYEVKMKPPSIRVRGTSKPTLSHQDLERLRNLFLEKEFGALVREVELIQSEFEADASCEYKVYDLFRLFEVPLPAYEGLLDQWAAYDPSSFAPYLARAHYYYKMGWESRGYAYAADTSDEQFQGMRFYFRKASRDAGAALAINPRLLTAYLILIGIQNVDGDEGKEESIFNRARSFFPDSFLLYNQMLWARLPRWGGSYPEMNRIAMEAFDHIQSNPELYMLFGEIYADQAWYMRQENHYDQALALYTQAIGYGEHHGFFLERGRTYFYMEQYDQALEDIEHSISLRPAIPVSYRLRAKVNMYKGNPAAALQEIHTMEALFPGDSETRECKEWTAEYLLKQGHAAYRSDLEQAVDRYTMALAVNPQLVEALYWRGSARVKLDMNDLALSDFRQTIEHDPGNFQSYRMLDYLLALQGRWDEIIAYWDRFLALEPGHADAYLERAGTYRHKGEMEHALADLKRACDLGNQDACKYWKRYR